MHRHILAAGWTSGGHIYRECTECRKVYRQDGRQLIEINVRLPGDYAYYKRMAEYYD